MTSLLSSWLRGGKKDEPQQQSSEGSGATPWHYGTEHHMDVYGPLPLDVKKQAVRDLYAGVCKMREGEAAPGDRDIMLKNKRQERVMKRHFEKVEIIHKMLKDVATREHEALYNPADCVPTKEISYAEWQHEELLKLIARREKAMEIDAKRPDLNRRSMSTGMLPMLNALTPREFISAAPTEPGHWPKRAFYYPVTDFSQLSSPKDKPAEQLLLERAVMNQRDEIKFYCTFLFAATGAVVSLLRPRFRPPVVIGTFGCVGFCLDNAFASFQASHAEQDLDDFNVAKNVWFTKNRPQMYGGLGSGVRASKPGVFLDKTNLEGGSLAGTGRDHTLLNVRA
ncbi:hypothetical protein DIPPA_02146 [Diplonema papillatum]|nr:hypothetical protein DIPPA_02146 [Diplonema papillatum]